MTQYHQPVIYKIAKIIAINLLILTGILACLFIMLEFTLSSEYSGEYLTQAKKFDTYLDNYNFYGVKLKNKHALSKMGLNNVMEMVYKQTTNHSFTNKQNYRIIILGDSFIAGEGVPWGGTWDGILINYVEAFSPDIEIFSFGRNGLSTLEEFFFLSKNIHMLKPDMVVFSFVTNDLYFHGDPDTEISNRILFIEKYADKTGFPYRLKSLNFLKKSVNNLFIRYYPYYGYEGWLERLYEDPNLNKYVNLLESIKKFARSHDFELLFYIYPQTDYKDSTSKQYLNKIRQVFKSKSIQFLDPLAYMENFTGHFSGNWLVANPADRHPGLIPNFITADFFIRFLCDKRLLGEECQITF